MDLELKPVRAAHCAACAFRAAMQLTARDPRAQVDLGGARILAACRQGAGVDVVDAQFARGCFAKFGAAPVLPFTALVFDGQAVAFCVRDQCRMTRNGICLTKTTFDR